MCKEYFRSGIAIELFDEEKLKLMELSAMKHDFKKLNDTMRINKYSAKHFNDNIYIWGNLLFSAFYIYSYWSTAMLTDWFYNINK